MPKQNITHTRIVKGPSTNNEPATLIKTYEVMQFDTWLEAVEHLGEDEVIRILNLHLRRKLLLP